MKEQEKTSPSVKWIFNSLMIWGAVLGFLIGLGAVEIQGTWRHQGSGSVWYEQPDRAERVSEKEYKRQHYTMGGGLLITGLVLWIVTANGAKNKAAMRAAHEDYLDAKTKTNAAYHTTFAKVMGSAVYQSAATEAMKDPVYQAAKATEVAKSIVCYVASKADKE